MSSSVSSNRRRWHPSPLHIVLVLLLILYLSSTFTPVSAVPLYDAAQDSRRAAPGNVAPPSTRSAHLPVISEITNGWTGVIITAVISLPWAIIGVFDAIDAAYRQFTTVLLRLVLASSFLLVAYTLGTLFVIGLVQQVEEGIRYDEVSTIIVLLLFNLWHVSRNVRGWSQLVAIRRVRPVFLHLQRKFCDTFPSDFHLAHDHHNADDDPKAELVSFASLNTSLQGSSSSPSATTRSTATGAPSSPVVGSSMPRPFPRGALSSSSVMDGETHHQNNLITTTTSTIDHHTKGGCIQGLIRLQISNRLIDNDLHTPTPFLSPLFRLRPKANAGFPTEEEEAWAVAIWRAWWTQDITVSGLVGRVPGSTINLNTPDLAAPADFLCDAAHRHPGVEGLDQTDPSGLASNAPPVYHQDTKERITSKTQWAKALLTYGSPEGQQDTHGDALPMVASMRDASGIALLIYEKTTHLPHRMSALWYNCAHFEDMYDNRAFDLDMRRHYPCIMLPKWPSWLGIARELASLYAASVQSELSLTLLAGELASTSLILVRYADKYKELVDQIHRDGLNARWTFGWSGLLACFSHLWTKDRIYIAMLNGLSLLAMTSSKEVKGIDPNVRSMLYGYASFAVSDRAVGRRIADDRKQELVKRYRDNKGKTCRGSGLCAIRLACKILGLPQEAGYFDGLPAFSAGWASEFLERKPGNQKPEHGLTHDEVEMRQGSSNAWRYPYTHT